MLPTVTLLAAASLATATALEPWLGAMLLACLLPWDYPVSMLGMTVYSLEWAVAGVMLGFGLFCLRRRNGQRLDWSGLLLALPFLAALALSALNALHPWAVFKQSLRWLQLIVVAWFVSQALLRPEKHLLAIRAFIAAAAVAAGFGILQSLAGPGSPLNYFHSQMLLYQGALRAYSTFGHPNQFAGYLICVFPLACVQGWLATGGRQRLAWGAAMLLIGLAIVLTYTRSAWASLLLAGLAWFYLKVPVKITIRLTALAAIGLGIFWVSVIKNQSTVPSVLQRAASMASPGQEDSVHFRLVCIKTGLAMVREHPWLGFGAGEYVENVRRFYPRNYYAWEAVSKHIHNLYLQIAIESGILGLLGFTIFLGYYAWHLGRAFFRPHGIWLEAAACGLLAYALANGLDVLTIYGRGVYAGVLLGIAMAASRQNSETVKSQAGVQHA